MSRVLQSTHIQIKKSLQEILATSGSFRFWQEDIDARDELCLNHGKIIAAQQNLGSFTSSFHLAYGESIRSGEIIE